MNSKHFEISRLVILYLNNEISEDQLSQLMKWCDEYPFLKEWLDGKDLKNKELHDRYEHFDALQLLGDWQNIERKATKTRRRRRFKTFAAAASVLIILASGLLVFNKQDSHKQPIARSTTQVVSPASKQALLTLSDGSVVGLGTGSNQIIEEGDLKLKAGSEALNYAESGSNLVYMHKITVPRGSTYFVELADGTKVWLNAASEMEFPTAFKGSERAVHLTGEAYFEVAKNPSMPFRVMVGNTTIEAVGTAFNINTHWKAGFVKTILTEGKIKVEADSQDKLMQKGFAAITGDGYINIQKADLEEALAWKEGFFYFNEKTLPEILDEICRWYNVDLKTEIKLNDDKYKGGMKRTESISAVCKMLEDLSGYKLKVINRTLIIK